MIHIISPSWEERWSVFSWAEETTYALCYLTVSSKQWYLEECLQTR